MLGVILDCIENYLNGAPEEFIELHKVLKAAECLVLPLIPFWATKGLFNSNYWDKVRIYAYSLIIVNTICNLLTLFLPSLNMIDENNYYQRNFYAVVFSIVLILLTIIMILGAIQSAKKMQSNNTYLLMFIFTFIMVGMLFRLLYMHKNFDYLVITISFQLLIFNSINVHSKIERLTGLLNRSTYETMRDKINYTTGLVIIDVNKLKWVNDTLGHKYGDILLKVTSEIIQQVYGKYAYCYRIGGDEFCVIMKQKAFESLKSKEHGRYEVMKNLMAEFNQEFAKRAEKRHFLKYGASQGSDIYYAKDDPEAPPEESYLTFVEVMHKADERMYEEKKLCHAFFDEEQKKEQLPTKAEPNV